MNVLAPEMYKLHTEPTKARTSKLPPDSRKTTKRVSFSIGVILTTSVSRPQLKSNPIEDRVMLNNRVIPTTSVSRPHLKSNPKGDRVLRSNSHGKKLEVEEHRRSVKLFKNKMPVTTCTDNLNAKTVNVKYVSAMCAKSVMINKHDLRVP
nr:hypothetical protein [Tanacetum cinerariifolium]